MHGDTSVFLELSEEVLDQVAPFIGFGIELRREAAVRFRRNDGGDIAFGECASEPVGIEGPVGQQMVSREILDQLLHPSQIVCLSRQQPEIDRVSKSICQRQYLGRDAAARASYGLALSPPLAP